MNAKVAHFLSALLHPLFMPTLLYGVIFYFAPTVVSPLSGASRVYVLGGISIATFLMPVLLIYVLYQFNAVASLRMEAQHDRTLPFLATTLIYGAFTYFFYTKLSGLPVIYLILGSITVAIGVVTCINLFWKISAHSVGICGMVGSLVGIQYNYADSELFYPILVTILIAGLLISARLSLNAHTPAQVLAGSLLGLVISLGAAYWLV